MSKKKKDETKNKRQSQPLAVETVYSRDEILVSASSFGVLPEVLAGALALLDGDEFSKKQVEKAVNDFKKRVIK